MNSRPFRTRVWAVWPADFRDSEDLEEVEEGVWIQLRCMSLPRGFRCSRYGRLVVLWGVHQLRVDVVQSVVDLLHVVAE